MEPKIVFEDEEILVLEKPAGMVVNRAESAKGETVQDWVEEKLKTQNSKLKTTAQKSKLGNKYFWERGGIVHRLDKETSGLLLVAKTPEAFENLQKQFKERRVEKHYLALVHGLVEPKEGEIRAPVGRLPWNRERFGVLAGGRSAKTRYKVLRYLKRSDLPAGQTSPENIVFSLLELKPETGRTHQIRVHLKFWGHPIVADEFYAGRKTSRRDREWCPRLFLHASFIVFVHPKTGKKMEFSLPLPSDLKKALDQLQ